MQFFLNPAVLVAMCAVATTAIVCAAWVLTVAIQARAHSEAERAYRLHVAEQQRVESLRYQVVLAHEQRVLQNAEVSR